MERKDYLANASAERFNEIIPKRRAIIEAAPAVIPRYEYNANILARDLHPKCQHVIVSAIDEVNGGKCFTLQPDRSRGIEKLACFRAGQYISLRLNIGDSSLTRPYSLCSSPKQALSGCYQILVKNMANGFASQYINEQFKVGTALDISEPSGFFNYEPLRDCSTVIGIAGGSGIAPFMSLARAIVEGTEDFNLFLLYGSRKEEDIIFKAELDALEAQSQGKIRVVHVLSDEQKPGYAHGFITADLIAAYKPAECSVFVCGSQGMYDFIEKETAKLSLPRRLVRFDAYGQYRLTDRDREFTEQYGDRKFELTVIMNDEVVHKVPMDPREPILVAMEKAGIKAPSKCRSGECGFCRSHLVEGEVYAPTRVEYRRQYDKEKDYIHPCCTFPRSDCKILINYEEPGNERPPMGPPGGMPPGGPPGRPPGAPEGMPPR